MKQLETIFTNISFVPLWAQDYLSALVGILFLLIIINLILKNLQTPHLKSAIEVIKTMGTAFFRETLKSIELPTKHPRLEFVGLMLFMVNSYIMAVILFAFFGVIFFLSMSAEHFTFWSRNSVIAFSLILLFIIRFCYAEGERQRLAVIKKWKSLK